MTEYMIVELDDRFDPNVAEPTHDFDPGYDPKAYNSLINAIVQQGLSPKFASSPLEALELLGIDVAGVDGDEEADEVTKKYLAEERRIREAHVKLHDMAKSDPAKASAEALVFISLNVALATIRI